MAKLSYVTYSLEGVFLTSIGIILSIIINHYLISKKFCGIYFCHKFCYEVLSRNNGHDALGLWLSLWWRNLMAPINWKSVSRFYQQMAPLNWKSLSEHQQTAPLNSRSCFTIAPINDTTQMNICVITPADGTTQLKVCITIAPTDGTTQLKICITIAPSVGSIQLQFVLPTVA